MQSNVLVDTIALVLVIGRRLSATQERITLSKRNRIAQFVQLDLFAQVGVLYYLKHVLLVLYACHLDYLYLLYFAQVDITAELALELWTHPILTF
jgi:hypothetical protein